MKNKKGEQRINNKATSIISLILLIIFMGGIIGGLGWATKGFKDKSFGNLTDIVDGYIKKKESNKKEIEGEKKQENKFKLNNGIDVSDYSNTLDYEYMKEKKESNALYMAPLRSGENTEEKNIYMSFSQWPENFATETIFKAKLTFYNSGKTKTDDGIPITDYVELDKTEFLKNEQLKVTYKKVFDEYIELIVTISGLEYKLKLGCRGNKIDITTLNFEDNVVYNFDSDKFECDIAKMLKDKGHSLGTEDKLTSDDIFYEFYDMCVFDRRKKAQSLEERFYLNLKLAQKLQFNEPRLTSMFEDMLKSEEYIEYEKAKKLLGENGAQKQWKKLLWAINLDIPERFLKHECCEIYRAPSRHKGMQELLGIYLRELDDSLKDDEIKELAQTMIYYRFGIGFDKGNDINNFRRAIEKVGKEYYMYIERLFLIIKYQGKEYEIGFYPKKFKGKEEKVEEITSSFNSNQHIFG